MFARCASKKLLFIKSKRSLDRNQTNNVGTYFKALHKRKCAKMSKNHSVCSLNKTTSPKVQATSMHVQVTNPTRQNKNSCFCRVNKKTEVVKMSVIFLYFNFRGHRLKLDKAREDSKSCFFISSSVST